MMCYYLNVHFQGQRVNIHFITAYRRVVQQSTIERPQLQTSRIPRNKKELCTLNPHVTQHGRPMPT